MEPRLDDVCSFAFVDGVDRLTEARSELVARWPLS
jgi:hypothetical protein